MKEKLRKAIGKIEKMCLSQSYDDYLNDHKKIKGSIPIRYFSGISFVLTSIFLNLYNVSDLDKFNEVVMWISALLLIAGMGFLLSTANLVTKKGIEKSKILNKEDFLISELKNSTLSFEQIKSLDSSVLLIKNNLKESEFEELLFKVEKKSGEEIGNAYFYYVLFSNYDDIISEIKSEKKQKEMIIKKSNMLIGEKVGVSF